MSREHRLDAEQRLKAGKLRALVATASLELGIDIGDVDLVCQIGATKSIAAFLQRVGRSGHGIDRTPKGRLFPLSRDELVECVALLDAVQKGELDRLQLADDTIVVLWGDHGFHLGDLGIWTKHTNYEQANRIPILITAPGVTQPSSSTKQLTESVDLFPTLAELAGLPVPNVPQSIDGVSLVPVLKDPGVGVRDHAYHVYPRNKLGRAIRTERYRFVQWQAIGKPESTAEFELYDYVADPTERGNLAAKYPDIVVTLMEKLATYPPPVRRVQSKRQ